MRKVANELAFFAGADQAGGLKLLHVVREGGGADGDALAHLGTGHRGLATRADLAEDLVAARVGKGFGDQLELIFGELGGMGGYGHVFSSDAAGGQRTLVE